MPTADAVGCVATVVAAVCTAAGAAPVPPAGVAAGEKMLPAVGDCTGSTALWVLWVLGLPTELLLVGAAVLFIRKQGLGELAAPAPVALPLVFITATRKRKRNEDW